MNHQYIGARYVPKFSNINDGVWDNSYSYEALEIVKHGNDFYTSKIPVPTGIAITNTTYWVKTGDYNGAISGLDTRLTTAENDIIDLTADVNKRELNLLNRKFLFVGDSYGDQSEEWADLTAIKLNLPSANYDILCASGAGFVDHGNGSYKDQLIGYSGNKLDITDIIVCGGINDSRYTLSNITTLINAIKDFNNYAKANYPNARISVGFIGSCLKGISSDYDTFNINAQRLAMWAYYNQSATYFNVMGNVHNAIRTSARDNFHTDGLHPSSLGSLLIAEAIASNIMNGNYTVTYPKISDVITFESSFTGSELSVEYTIINDVTHIRISGAIRPHSVTIGQSMIKIGTLQQLCANERIEVLGRYTLQQHNVTGFKNIDVNLYIDGKSIYISQSNLNNDGSAYLSLVFDSDTQANNMYAIQNMQISIPTFSIN